MFRPHPPQAPHDVEHVTSRNPVASEVGGPFLVQQGVVSEEAREAFLSPSLDQVRFCPEAPPLQTAVQILRRAIETETPVAFYSDRDVDGLTGLAILTRSYRALGGKVVWGASTKGRGISQNQIDVWLSEGISHFVFIDCGTTDEAILQKLNSLGKTVFVVDHHRQHEAWPPATAWIHPMHLPISQEAMPAGCVMAFHLAHALWTSFLGQDQERFDYFLWAHLDLVALGILADRVPLRGDNRILAWHGLRQFATTRKRGLELLLRFFKLFPRKAALPPHEALWQLIPLLNAGGRLGHPEWTADLLMSDDPDTVHTSLDALLTLNSKRRLFQEESGRMFEEAILSQCNVTSDPILMAHLPGLEPAVSGLAAQQLSRRYGRPVFLFVEDEEEWVGSGRGPSEIDLFATISQESERFIKFGGHAGAVGLTIPPSEFAVVREAFLKRFQPGAWKPVERPTDRNQEPLFWESSPVAWYDWMQRLEPFGDGFERPLWRIKGCVYEKTTENRLRQLGSDHLFPLVDDRYELPTEPFDVILSLKSVTERKGSYRWIIESTSRKEPVS